MSRRRNGWHPRGARWPAAVAVIALAVVAALSGCAPTPDAWAPPLRLAAFYAPHPESFGYQTEPGGSWNLLSDVDPDSGRGTQVVMVLDSAVDRAEPLCASAWSTQSTASWMSGCTTVSHFNIAGLTLTGISGEQLRILPDGAARPSGFRRIADNLWWRDPDTVALDLTTLVKLFQDRPDVANETRVGVGVDEGDVVSTAWRFGPLEGLDGVEAEVTIGAYNAVGLGIFRGNGGYSDVTSATAFNADGLVLSPGAAGVGEPDIQYWLVPETISPAPPWRPSGYPNLWIRD